MASHNDKKEQRAKARKEGGGCLSPMKLIPVLFIGSLAFIVILVHSAPNLSRFEGRGEGATSSEPMAGVLGLAALKSMAAPGSPPYRFKEVEMNKYLSRVIQGRHQGWTGDFITFEEIAVDFQEGGFELLIARRFLQRTTAQTVRFSIERSNDQILIKPEGGRLGRLRLPSRLPMIGKAAFAEVARVLEPEIQTFLTVERIDFSDGIAEVHPFQ